MRCARGAPVQPGLHQADPAGDGPHSTGASRRGAQGAASVRASYMTMMDWLGVPEAVRGVSWSEVATVPKRKSHRGLDLNLSWNSEEDIWKGRKKSNGTEVEEGRRVKRKQPQRNTQVHMHGWDDACKADLSHRCDVTRLCINEQRSVCSVLSVVHVHVRDSVYVVHRVWLKVDVVVAIIYAVICS